MPGAFVGSKLLSWLSGAWLGSGRGIYIGTQKGYEKTDTVPVVVIDEENENLERTKPGTHRSITNFLEESIKNKK